jgi:hypothetical protein
MRRLEYTRRTRSTPANARNATEAVMFLAHVGRERNRLAQEKTTLEKRIRRIDARLDEIAGTETRLVPVIQSGLQRAGDGVGRYPPPAAAAAPEATLRY